jgi:hypothetical protein
MVTAFTDLDLTPLIIDYDNIHGAAFCSSVSSDGPGAASWVAAEEAVLSPAAVPLRAILTLKFVTLK